MKRLIHSTLLAVLLAISNSALALSNDEALFLFQQQTLETARLDAIAAAEEAKRVQEEADRAAEEAAKLEQAELDEAKKVEEAARAAEEEARKEQELRDSIVAREDIATVIKNIQTNVTGNVAGNDDGVKTVVLISPPTSNLGALTFDSSGTYTYTLNNNSTLIQSLNEDEYLKDVFAYFIEGEKGYSSTANLTINILGAPVLPTDNVEIEDNDTSKLATPLHSGQLIKGHFRSSSDKDWFTIASAGEEIIHLEVCPEGSTCFGRKSWVVYVFDSEKFTQDIEDTTIRLDKYRDDTGKSCKVSTTGAWCANYPRYSDHMYLAYNAGAYDSSLIGIIDPCFGETNSLDIGVGEGEKTYLIAVSTPLLGTANEEEKDEERGCGGGSIVLTRPGPSFNETTVTLVPAPLPPPPAEGEEPSPIPPPTEKVETVTITTTEEYISIFPYSDDQYTLTVSGTGLNPLLLTSAKSATFDNNSRTIYIPKVRVFDQLFSADLFLRESSEKSVQGNLKLSVLDLDMLTEDLTGDPLMATYNPINDMVVIPNVLDESTGFVYRVEMLYHHPQEGVEGWLELISATVVE